MNKNKLFLLLAILFFLFAGVTLLSYNSYYIDDIIYVNYTFFVGEKVGLAVDSDMLHMGMMHPGGASSREVVLKNTYGHDVNVAINIRGDRAEWLGVSDGNFALEKDANRTISFAVTPPLEAPYGNYSGYVKITFKRERII